MSVDLLDMNAFVSDEPQEMAKADTKVTDYHSNASSNLETDFLGDDEIGLRDHSNAHVLNPIKNPGAQ